MSQNKFTPGPFQSHDTPNWYAFDSRFYEVTDSEGLIVAFIKDWSDAPTQSRENARLFSAAPELLKELRKAVSEAEQSEFERWLSSESPSGDSEAVRSQWEQSANFQDFHSWWGAAIAAIAKARGESCSI